MVAPLRSAEADTLPNFPLISYLDASVKLFFFMKLFSLCFKPNAFAYY